MGNALDESSYLKVVKKALPGLQTTAARLNSAGQNNVILIVHDQWVFRFPKYAHLIEKLKIETDILLRYGGGLPVPVPQPEIIHLNVQPVGQAFVGYRFLPGEPLEQAAFSKISGDGALAVLARQITDFLRALHAAPLGEEERLWLPVYETRQEYQAMYEQVREKLFAFMRPQARQWAASHFETFLEQAANFTVSPVLRHGDFGTTNLLYDRRSQRLSGVIDFSSAGLGDPAVDYAGLLSSFGEPFFKRCMRCDLQIETLLPRIRFYRGIFALEEALFGLENGDPQAFQAGMARYV